jgi:hypothetical protein
MASMAGVINALSENGIISEKWQIIEIKRISLAKAAAGEN